MDDMEGDGVPCPLVDATEAVLCKILSHLNVQDLCSMAQTCKRVHALITTSDATTAIWHAQCDALLGMCGVTLHDIACGVSHMTLAQRCVHYRALAKRAVDLDRVYWWQQGTALLRASIMADDAMEPTDERDQQPTSSSSLPSTSHATTTIPASTPTNNHESTSSSSTTATVADRLASRCQRSGHTMVACGGQHVVVVGGILQVPLRKMDVMCVDLGTLQITRPSITGKRPRARFRHSCCVLQCSATVPTGNLRTQLLQQLPPGALHAGFVLLVFGGYNAQGEEFGGNQLEVLWVSEDCKHAHWCRVQTQGLVPAHVYHHTADLCRGGACMIVCGGESSWFHSRYSLEPIVYLLNLDTCTWTQQPTQCPSEAQIPRRRSLHMSTVYVDPVNKKEELIVVGGYYENELAPMIPFALDLDTFVWRRGPRGPVVHGGVQDPHNTGRLPKPRQRAACMRVGRWLLVHGGATANGVSLKDMHRLHLPSLTWGTPPHAHGDAAQHNIAGHCLVGGLAFGGCMATILGVLPISKLDLMLLMPGSVDFLIPNNTAPSAIVPMTNRSAQEECQEDLQRNTHDGEVVHQGQRQYERVVLRMGGSSMGVEVWRDVETGQLHPVLPSDAVQEEEEEDQPRPHEGGRALGGGVVCVVT